jgi:hypothetical protein
VNAPRRRSPLRADPIFFRSLTRGKGSRRTAFTVENTSPHPLECCVVAVRECPEWLQLEREVDGSVEALTPDPGAVDLNESERSHHPSWLILAPRRKARLIASIDTDHRFFPRALGELARPGAPDTPRVHNENSVIELELSTGQVLSIPLTLAEVVLERPAFDGLFALDFGTTNSCYGFKRRRAGPEGLERPPLCSSEIPSAVYFRDLRHRDRPQVLVGDTARLAMIAHPSRVYAYTESIKRLLGSDRTLTVLDARGRSATYRPEEVAACAVRAILERAEAEHLDGQRVQRVIATYPTLFSPRHRRALQDAVLLALEGMHPGSVPPACLEPGPRTAEVQAQVDDRVLLRLDEANAATFRYITGPLLEACLRFNRAQERDVLAFDFGGGTIDVSYLRVKIGRDTALNSTRIETLLKGVTGEPSYGGDNVSLELVRLLRAKLALEAAHDLLSEAQDRVSQTTASEGLDIFDRILSGAAAPLADAGLDPDQPWSPRREQRPEGQLPEWDDEFAPPPRDRRLAACRLLVQHSDLILEAVTAGILEHPQASSGKDSWVERLRDLLHEQAREAERPFDPREAERVDEALETLVPTRFARYADEAPMMERRAKVFFMDLWREANDRLKPLLVARTGGDPSRDAAQQATACVQEPLERLAHYVGVDPKLWSDRVVISLAELDAMIEPRLRRAVVKARDLYLGAVDTEGERDPQPDPDALLSTSHHPRDQGEGARRSDLTVLITGNSSILPVVHRTFADVFRGIDHEIVYDERTRKTAVVQGAVEECLMAREFGRDGGGIHYASLNFLDRLPFSIGLYSRFVGFRPVFTRGARADETVVVDALQNELINRGLEDLPVYADYHDGAPVRYLGVFDFRRDAGREATFDELSALPVSGDESAEPTYRVGFRLLPDWELELLDPEAGRVYRLSLEDVRIDPREDPFSGEN